MKKVKDALRVIYSSPDVRKHAFDLLKIVIGVLLAHYGIKYS